MDIKNKKAVRATALLVLAILVTATIFGLSRFIGDDFYHRVFAVNEARRPNAILSRMIEGYREAKSVAGSVIARSDHAARLESLSNAVKTETLSLKPLLDESLANSNDRKITEQFWREVDTRFLPAVKKYDEPEITASFERLTALYTTASLFIVKTANGNSYSGSSSGDIKGNDVDIAVPISVFLLVSIAFGGAIVAAWVAYRIFNPAVSAARLQASSIRTRIWQKAEREARTNLDVSLSALRTSLYDFGLPAVDGDILFFGAQPINNYNEIVDSIQKRYGAFATIFMGNKRIATNLLRSDGVRAVNTLLMPGAAYESVLNQGKPFRGEVILYERTFLAIYEPIIVGGAVIGILFVGARKRAFRGVLAAFRPF